MSLSAQLFGRDSLIHRATNILGLGIPSWLDRKFGPQEFNTDVGKSGTAPQGSEYGADIPHIYGTCATTGSQIAWMENNALKEVVKKKKQGGGKGGGGSKQTVTTYTYFATVILILCKGKVSGIRRIWCGDKLIYNAGSDDLETVIASNKAQKGWKFYDGSDDQMPDPRYEADVGVGNAPAFRGFAYLALYDFALKDYANTLQGSQFKVELVDQEEFINITPMLNQDSNDPSDCGAWISDDLENVYLQITDANLKLNSHTINSRFISGSMPAGVIYPLGWCGDETVYCSSGLTHIITDDGALPLAGLAPGQSSILRGFESDGAYYVQWATEVCRTKLGELPITVTGTYTICPGDGVFYGVDRYNIITYDLDDLSVIRSVPFSPTYAPTYAGLSNISFDGGILWYQWSNYDAFEGFDPVTGEKLYTFMLPLPGTLQDGIGLRVLNGVAVVVARPHHDTGAQCLIRAYRIFGTNVVKPTLASIILSECESSELITPIDMDVSLLTQEVNGYRVTGGTIRSAIEPLQAAYPFDVVPSGYRLKFIPRGQSSVLSIPWEDLAANDGSEIGESLPYSREMDSQLPQKVSITAISSNREYGASLQSRERLSTAAVNVEELDVPLVLSDDEIAQMADKLLFLRWQERDDFSFSLPPSYLALEPADIVTVNARFGTFELRITRVTYEADGRLTCSAKANNAAIYSSLAVGAPGPGPDGTIPLAGETVMVLADAPMIYETFQNSPGISTAATGYSSGWPGAVLVRSADGGQTWVDLQGYAGVGTLGYARNSLAVNSGSLIYEGSGLQIDLLSGDLESITRDQMLAGQNFALYGADQRWEVIRFRDATQQSDGSFLLTGILRGDKGTEWATGLHEVGDLFVLADDPDNIFVGTAIETLGISMRYRAVTSGSDIDAAADQQLAYRGVNLKPLSPTFPRGVRNVSGDLTATIQRRSRFTNSWWITGVSGPVGEATESYEADVMSGGIVKRTLTSTNGIFSYPADQQISDFGSTQAAVTLRFYQMSATVGRGYVLEATL
ncbi:phage tail protein [Pseudomonas sp.]|uniref:phage tail protein n=1 Tax=Pseudomonas sp. TaxID=306 RepID=UPI0029070811|nr:phage tail protein [Pseudomonas sp.]MDU4248997.1 phage tail protein [Pseudomonas sp.]